MSSFSLNPRTIRTLIAAAVIAIAVNLAQSRDALHDFTRPLVVATLHLLGMDATDKGQVIAVGDLDVPWTRDCAGINLLLILLALAVWVNRQEKIGTRFWLRVAAMIPAALAANILRVLTVIAYRKVFYPAIESPQTHYFMGFLWMVPFVTAITPRGQRTVSQALLETFHAAAVVALLTPLSGTPNGELISIAAVIALAHCRHGHDLPKLRLGLTGLWALAGAAIALVNLESFWLPWLLLCPIVADLRWLKSAAGVSVMVCTHSMFAMQPWAPAVGGLGIAYAVWIWLRHEEETSADAPASPAPRWMATLPGYACLLCFTLPFTASTLLSIGIQTWTPPATITSRPIKSQGYEVLLPGQPENIGLACYGPTGRDRHHTVQVCLKYRGLDVVPSGESPDIFTDGQHWLREYFLHDGRLLADYPSYLRQTFRPWADPGVHLIFVAPKDKIPAADFSKHCQELAQTFYTLSTAPTPAPPVPGIPAAPAAVAGH